MADQDRGALVSDADDASTGQIERNAATAERVPHAERYGDALNERASLSTSNDHRIPVRLSGRLHV